MTLYYSFCLILCITERRRAEFRVRKHSRLINRIVRICARRKKWKRRQDRGGQKTEDENLLKVFTRRTRNISEYVKYRGIIIIIIKKEKTAEPLSARSIAHRCRTKFVCEIVILKTLGGFCFSLINSFFSFFYTYGHPGWNSFFMGNDRYFSRLVLLPDSTWSNVPRRGISFQFLTSKSRLFHDKSPGASSLYLILFYDNTDQR